MRISGTIRILKALWYGVSFGYNKLISHCSCPYYAQIQIFLLISQNSSWDVLENAMPNSMCTSSKQREDPIGRENVLLINENCFILPKNYFLFGYYITYW